MQLDKLIGRRGNSSPPSSLEELRTNGSQLKEQLAGSSMDMPGFFNKQKAWEAWEKGRKPIADLIDELFEGREEPLRTLDYGCANGLLLFSLKHWSRHEIEPFGYDTNKDRIASARALFPDRKEHFAEKGKFETLPSSYDLVYWNLWDQWNFAGPKKEERLALFTAILSSVQSNGYLVIGFYDENPAVRQQRLQMLIHHGFIPAGSRESETGKETFVWLNGTGPAS